MSEDERCLDGFHSTECPGCGEARAEPRAEGLDRSKPCPGDLLCCRYQGHDGEHLYPVTWSQYAALEEPTP